MKAYAGPVVPLYRHDKLRSQIRAWLRPITVASFLGVAACIVVGPTSDHPIVEQIFFGLTFLNVFLVLALCALRIWERVEGRRASREAVKKLLQSMGRSA